MKRSKPKRKSLGDSLRSQVKSKIANEKKESSIWTPPKGTGKFLLSTGSTLVDLAITGRRFRGGGIPFGIFCEIFGASARGKTVKLLEMAGNIQRMGGDYLFIDPEARVNKEFARIFDFNINDDKYKKSATAEEAFDLIRKWKPEGKGPHAIFMDSLAAFVSDDENEDKGDNFSGARKAKEFSQELRKSTRLIEEKNYLVVATNQVRQILGATAFQKKTKATGGEAPKFYASLRLELLKPPSDGKIILKKTINGVDHTRTAGVQTKVFVEKSTISSPYQSGIMRILFDYGVDDITPNLVYLKRNLKTTTYVLKGEKIGSSITSAINYIEKNNLEKELREEVIDLWTTIQKALTPDRKKKVRF